MSSSIAAIGKEWQGDRQAVGVRHWGSGIGSGSGGQAAGGRGRQWGRWCGSGSGGGEWGQVIGMLEGQVLGKW